MLEALDMLRCAENNQLQSETGMTRLQDALVILEKNRLALWRTQSTTVDLEPPPPVHRDGQCRRVESGKKMR
jgi:hypothetical protein